LQQSPCPDGSCEHAGRDQHAEVTNSSRGQK
jgi:hypothetical protein